MINSTPRPPKLPNFLSPPLNEVVLGVQFSPPHGYQQIRAGEVWNIFKERYPKVVEMQALQPTFETFGLSLQQLSMKPQFDFVIGGTHDRFWFVESDGNQLIQFQQDRLLHNWRKINGNDKDYPRFEAMISSFENELQELESYFNSLQPQTLSINQCEISYINHLPFNRDSNDSYSDWLSFLKFSKPPPENFTFSFREVIKDSDGTPRGRLYVESALGTLNDDSEIIGLTLTFKGAPPATNINSALEFISFGRNVVVQKFAELTTNQAHKFWERTN